MSLPNSLKLSSRFDSFQKYIYSQTWPKNTNNFMTKHFLILELSGVYNLYLMNFFDDLLSLKI